MIDISAIHFHDTQVLRVIEEPESDTLILEVEYPVDWEENKFERRRLVFTDSFNYQVHEQPFVGAPTILSAKVMSDENGWSRRRLETNAGFREVFCKAVRLTEA